MLRVLLRLGSNEVLGSLIIPYSILKTYRVIVTTFLTFRFLDSKSKFINASIMMLKLFASFEFLCMSRDFMGKKCFYRFTILSLSLTCTNSPLDVFML